MSATSYFRRTGDHAFQPTHWTSGAWNEEEQHFSPIAGLLVHAIDGHVAARGGDELVTARLTFDILGVVALEEMTVEVRTVRPGRTIELVEATVSTRGRAAATARAWRMSTDDTSAVAGGEAPHLPDPATVEPWAMTAGWPGDYIRSLDVRAVAGPDPGRATVWMRSDVQLVEGEQASALAHFVRLSDTANGIAVRQSPREWMFPNLDLTIHLHRQPRGDWTGLDTSVVFGPTGQGVTSTVLHDVDGPVGRAEQSLTVRPLTPARG